MNIGVSACVKDSADRGLRVVGGAVGGAVGDHLSASPSVEGMDAYLATLSMVERLHRLMLDVIKDELDRLRIVDATAVQALLVFNIGDADLSPGDLRAKGYYLGSNVSYNLKKLVEAGFVRHNRSEADRRSVRIGLTEKGFALRAAVASLFGAHAAAIRRDKVMSIAINGETVDSLRKIERFWRGTGAPQY